MSTVRLTLLGALVLAAGAFFLGYRMRGEGASTSEGAHAEHEGEDAHAGHEGEEGAHAEHEEEGVDEVHLTPEQCAEIGLATQAAERRNIPRVLQTTGEVQLNADRVTHIVPVVPGIVVEVSRSLGDLVRKGEMLARINSTELGEAKLAFLQAQVDVEVAEKTCQRERSLLDRKATTEQAVLEAEGALRKATVHRTVAETRLHFLGLNEEEVARISREHGQEQSVLTLTAPLDGRIVSKHISLGEYVAVDQALFEIADLGTLWVLADVYERDLAAVLAGPRRGECDVRAFPNKVFPGEVTYLTETMDATTRTVKVRLSVPNPEGLLRPGMFATVRLSLEERPPVVAVPEEALLSEGGRTCLFVAEEGGVFHRRWTETGVRSGGWVEVPLGIVEGEPVVTRGAFLLLSELAKKGFGGEHAGHAH